MSLNLTVNSKSYLFYQLPELPVSGFFSYHCRSIYHDCYPFSNLSNYQNIPQASYQSITINFNEHSMKENMGTHSCIKNPLTNKALQSDQHKGMKLMCKLHSIESGGLFCIDCLDYCICTSCLKDGHEGHNVQQYKSFEEAQYETKELLLENLEETLVGLRSHENQMKNRNAEVVMVLNKVKHMEQDILQSLKAIFDSISKQITEHYYFSQQHYKREINDFYDDYNHMNDSLRQILLSIINGHLDPYTINRATISQMRLPELPDFSKIKTDIDKGKRYCKTVKEQLILFEKGIRPQKENKCHERYDKYLPDSKVVVEPNQSLLRTLKLMDRDYQVPLNKLRN